MQTILIFKEKQQRNFGRKLTHLSHNVFDISQSHHRIVRVSKGSNKNSFAINLFQFCDSRTQLRYIVHEKSNFSKRKIIYLADDLHNFASL